MLDQQGEDEHLIDRQRQQTPSIDQLIKRGQTLD
jgi:hypothetical protein